MTKSELLDWLQEAYQQWEAFLGQIDPARMDQPGVHGDWSMKDIIAHLTGWNRWLVIHLQAAQRGEPEPPSPWPAHLEGEDEINAWIYADNRERPLHEVLDEMQQVHQQLLAVVASLPADVRIEQVEPQFHRVWVDDKRFLADAFFEHFHFDHEQDVRAWLARDQKKDS